MDTWPRISALGMLLIAAFGYVFITPLRILAKTRYPANPQLQLIDTERLPLPQLVQQHFDVADVELRQAGFEAQGTLLAAGHVANVSTLFRVYANRDAMDLAIVTSVFVTAKDRAARHFPFVQFSSRWATGWGLLTSNPPVMSVFPPRPNVLAVRGPWIVDVTKLYQVHRAVGSAMGPAVRKVERLFAEFHGDLATYYTAVMREEMEDAARRVFAANGRWDSVSADAHGRVFDDVEGVAAV